MIESKPIMEGESTNQGIWFMEQIITNLESDYWEELADEYFQNMNENRNLSENAEKDERLITFFNSVLL